MGAKVAMAVAPILTAHALQPAGQKGPEAEIVQPSTSSTAQVYNFDPHDISHSLCWVGGFTKETCCRGDATTSSQCWKDSFSFSECCPNAECWDDDRFTYDECCDEDRFGTGGNPACWSTDYTFEHCCMADGVGRSWVEVLTNGVDMGHFYSMDEFYTDAQYGDDFGYYSTGRVLKNLQATPEESETDAQQFAHFTTYPMAMSPHFGRVLCRMLLLMWIELGEQEPFRVVEMGAGSGQLGNDIRQCVKDNELGLDPSTWRRWAGSFEYQIMERSPALAKRQIKRGLRVVPGDAQSVHSCKDVLAAFTDSPACKGFKAGQVDTAPECVADAPAVEGGGISALVSNELLDAFAPLKLRLSTMGRLDVTTCSNWQEIKYLHVMQEKDFAEVSKALGHTPDYIREVLIGLRSFTSEMFCGIRNTTVGEAAAQCSPESSCLAIVFGLSELLKHVDLQLPSAAHNMRLRLRKDYSVCHRFRDLTGKIDSAMEDVVVLPKHIYRQLRHELRSQQDVEVQFLATVQTWTVPVHLSSDRCATLQWWFDLHEERIQRLVDVYKPLGYPAVQFVVRPGERDFVELADCLMGPNRGFMLSIDYGASFEALGHSLSVDPYSDGIFIPPAPTELLTGLPECFSSWPVCAGRVDWTTFVDFTNVAAVGESLGWGTLLYGPQSVLEHMSTRLVQSEHRNYSVPGYGVLGKTWASRHIQNWYGRETLASTVESAGWEQRWTSFKALLMQKKPKSSASGGDPATRSSPAPAILASPSWHLDTQKADRCWSLDPSSLPLADWISRHPAQDPREALLQITQEISDKMGPSYSQAYEEAQFAVRLMDWLVASEGCAGLIPAKIAQFFEDPVVASELTARARKAWSGVWGESVVDRMISTILRPLLGGDSAPGEKRLSPSECLGREAHRALCLMPGDSDVASTPIYPPTS
mmetsp:Transcript_60357/g.127851  ORF Transcript_60357/g.127851 Transcript_60357/m.127851 type:complete len:928 (-) Transcript_60357:7-2790(-)